MTRNQLIHNWEHYLMEKHSILQSFIEQLDELIYDERKSAIADFAFEQAMKDRDLDLENFINEQEEFYKNKAIEYSQRFPDGENNEHQT